MSYNGKRSIIEGQKLSCYRLLQYIENHSMKDIQSIEVINLFDSSMGYQNVPEINSSLLSIVTR